ncbi:5-methylthioadenosine/S-adenosylhomocysteine deaminase [Bradyrhizobium japonicum]|uniref:amidohydrolase family protein n=1 Tax=Bradyrhizobium TaxID=374 RepID=UPI0003649F26|nr:MULTISPECIES: amidohydrolase family protein [Bradyrhizobium]MBP2429177.1 cytosine/adenosine deaminase-related metal-dependent hydrolase [Bradyrhizobium elkanii]MCP1737352.1 cytosine/adenosine deaminase-related metal-dependent hydrolase [Bradyrhizobium elkanii]MCS3572692.1 cytosine/adenosine deaminase-related metal-dependent hydrolase [Bradyrhizobium elkanii]MCS3585824.1 cytosine/adenosine deaminase-related metal-dependent hydrolase [Bradyrhizobium elkanii]MCS3624058.1 cytosine/adenosine dea
MQTQQTLSAEFRALSFAVIITAFSQSAAAQNFLLNGNVVTPSGVVQDGWVFIKNDKIVSVTATQPNVQGQIVRSSDYIYPGLVDLHNHPIYDTLPRWTPPHLYNNRYEWRRDPVYQNEVQVPERNIVAAEFCDMDEFAEIKQLIGGTTTLLGISPPAFGKPMYDCIKGLARNLDWYSGFYGTNIGHEPVANPLGVTPPNYSLIAQDWPGDMKPADLLKYQSGLRDGSIKAFFIHLAEGKRTDAEAQSEFGLLKDDKLLTASTVIIHGVGLVASDFADMSKAGASLVWSPRSNLVLYGETTDVETAAQQGVTIAIAPDWSPTGSSNMLAELKFASDYSTTKLNGLFSAKQLFEMATSIPARMAHVDQLIGTIEAGRHADIFMMSGHSPDAYSNLVTASPSDVSLTIVNGVPVYGTPDHMAQAGVSTTEDVSVCGEKRSLNSQALTVSGAFAAATTQLGNALTGQNTSLGPIAECN